MSLKLLILLISLELGYSQTPGNVCNQAELGLNELQANQRALRKDVDTLRNATNLLLNHYMQPHEVQSRGNECATTGQPPLGRGNECATNGQLPLGTYQNPANSCQQMAEINPSSLPGYVWVNSGSDGPAFVYCTPNTQCCTNSSIQGWMRVANLDMTDRSQGCPTGFRLTTTPERGCFRTTTPGCTSVTFDTHNITYSNICGRVIGYSHRSLDAFRPYSDNRGLTLDDEYLDGVSITRGSPRQHIWTFAASGSFGQSCPCTNNAGVVPPFINNEYFCEAGSTTEPMWDGGDCPSSSTCCSFNKPPWFCKELSQTTTDDIEVRVCADQSSGDEDLQIEIVELFVQ